MDFSTPPPVYDEVTVSLDSDHHHDSESGQQQAGQNVAEGDVPQGPPSLEQDFYAKPVEEIKKLSLPLKIHIGVGAGVSALCFLIWHFVTPGDPSQSIWWWIFPFFFFCITATLHHNIIQGKVWEGIAIGVVIVDIMLYMTYIVTRSIYPWWIYPWIATAMVLIPLYYRRKQDKTYSDVYNILWLEYWLVNLLLFLTWANTPLSHPWFFYPMIILAVPLIEYRAITYYKESRIPVLVGIPVVFLDVLFFVAWGFSPIGWPWFVIPVAITSGVLAIVIWKFKHHTTHQTIADGANPASVTPGGYDNIDSQVVYPPPATFPVGYPQATPVSYPVGYPAQ